MEFNDPDARAFLRKNNQISGFNQSNYSPRQLKKKIHSDIRPMLVRIIGHDATRQRGVEIDAEILIPEYKRSIVPRLKIEPDIGSDLQFVATCTKTAEIKSGYGCPSVV